MKAVKKALAFIEEAGFSHIKIEMEANMRRGSTRNCTDCTGHGRVNCADCGTLGYREPRGILREYMDSVECESCQGLGMATCSGCDGAGSRSNNFGSTEICHRFILDEVCMEIYGKTLDERVAEVGAPRRQTGAHGSYNIAEYKVIEGISYCEFYNDGSVDSECTVTIEVSRAIELSQAFLKAFKELARQNGSGMNVSGAGMHIAVLPTQSRGAYPGSYTMPARKVDNFKHQMTKLLPALFFCASADAQSRGFGYREPRISESKYSAIHVGHSNRYFEYRVFETCYKRPKAMFEYFQVIANSLRFYHDPSLQVKNLGVEYPFCGGGNNVSRLVQTVEQTKVINATLKHLKPEDVTIKQMRKDRGVTGTVKELVNKRKLKEVELKKDYEQHKKHLESVINQPLTETEKAQVDRYVIDGYRYDAAVARVKGYTPLTPLKEFIKRNLNDTPRNIEARILC